MPVFFESKKTILSLPGNCLTRERAAGFEKKGFLLVSDPDRAQELMLLLYTRDNNGKGDRRKPTYHENVDHDSDDFIEFADDETATS